MTTHLALDVAASTGWAIFTDGAYIDSGQCDAFGPEPLAICRRVLELDRLARVVAEKPWGGSLATIAGLGKAHGAWESAWRAATSNKTTVRWLRVFPQVWRAESFNSTANFPLQEKLTAALVSKKPSPGADESAAICIGRWATRTQSEKRSAPAPNAHRVRNGRRDSRSNRVDR